MIYCVEDDNSIRELVIYTLNTMQLQALGFSDASSFFAQLNVDKPKLIILDVMLPDMDGFEILKKLKTNPKTRDIAVIMATAKDSEIEKIEALDNGADDYLTKPFSVMEMVARVKAVLRRCSTNKNPKLITCAGISIDDDKHTVSVDGDIINLTNKEYQLLFMLCSHVGRVYSRDTLIKSVWNDNIDSFSRSLDVHVRSLRTKLGPYENIIKTVRGIGYKVEL